MSAAAPAEPPPSLPASNASGEEGWRREERGEVIVDLFWYGCKTADV